MNLGRDTVDIAEKANKPRHMYSKYSQKDGRHKYK